jgi:hypothetical protein
VEAEAASGLGCVYQQDKTTLVGGLWGNISTLEVNSGGMEKMGA